jgi:hypothetical protein
MSLRFVRATLLVGAMLVSAQSVLQGAEVIYSNFFESAVGPEWSSTNRDITPIGAKGFLGQFGSVSVEQSVTLTLGNIPPHTGISVSFDLFIIASWDGHGIDVGPDIWDLTIVGVTNLLHTTFSNVQNCFDCDRCQDFPGMYPGSDFSEKTGAVETNSLGFHFLYGSPCTTVPMDAGDAVYHLTFSFPHTDSSLVLDFSDSLTGSILAPDESWGLDNVVIAAEGLDSDSDGVLDEVDLCPGTAPGAIVNTNGCSIAQLCPCEGPSSGGTWANHNDYVRCVKMTTADFVQAGLLTQKEGRELTQSASRSRCGH